MNAFEITETTMARMKQMQKDCHRHVELLQSINPKLTYEAAQTTWLFMQIAKLQEQVEQLKLKTTEV